jgi:hypothetical protein
MFRYIFIIYLIYNKKKIKKLIRIGYYYNLIGNYNNNEILSCLRIIIIKKNIYKKKKKKNIKNIIKHILVVDLATHLLLSF